MDEAVHVMSLYRVRVSVLVPIIIYLQHSSQCVDDIIVIIHSAAREN